MNNQLQKIRGRAADVVLARACLRPLKDDEDRQNVVGHAEKLIKSWEGNSCQTITTLVVAKKEEA